MSLDRRGDGGGRARGGAGVTPGTDSGGGVMLLLVSSGVGLWLLGVEPLAVCCGEGGVGACAAFEFADPGRVGVRVVGGLGGG